MHSSKILVEGEPSDLRNKCKLLTLLLLYRVAFDLSATSGLHLLHVEPLLFAAIQNSTAAGQDPAGQHGDDGGGGGS